MSASGCHQVSKSPTAMQQPDWVWNPQPAHSMSLVVVLCCLVAGGLTLGGGVVVIAYAWGMLPLQYFTLVVTAAMIWLYLSGTPLRKSWLDDHSAVIVLLAVVGVVALIAYAFGTFMIPDLPSTEILCTTILLGLGSGTFVALLIMVAMAIFLLLQDLYKNRNTE
jgi:hypothetical protein